MKIAIITEGGRRIGFGHVTRCLALYQAFEKKGENPVLMINGDSVVRNLVKGKKVKVFNWIENKRRLFEVVKKSGIVIIDSYLAGAGCYDEISKISDIAAYMDDYRRIRYPKGIVVNGTAGAERLDYPKEEGVAYLLGPEYIPIRKEFWKVRRPRIKKEISEVLITFGGMPRKYFIKDLLKHLKKRFPRLNYHILTGKANLYDTASVRDLMLHSDLCISAGGQTLYELARCGIPTIGVSFAKNQMLNLKGLEKSGFLRYASRFSDKGIFDKIARHMKALSSRERRVAASRIGRKVVDGRGADRIADFVYKNMPQKITVRKAARKDCRDIWKWRNDPKIRASSFNKERIPYETHRKWFNDRVKCVSASLFIGENKNREKIGQARFDIDTGKRRAFISANLNPKFFGQGLGGRFIRLASEVFTREHSEVRYILAEVFRVNVISKKAFLKAGYVFLRNTYKNNKKICVFKYSRRAR